MLSPVTELLPGLVFFYTEKSRKIKIGGKDGAGRREGGGGGSTNIDKCK